MRILLKSDDHCSPHGAISAVQASRHHMAEIVVVFFAMRVVPSGSNQSERNDCISTQDFLQLKLLLRMFH